MADDGAFARWAYSTALRLATPLYVAKLWWRGRDEPPYRDAWGERFGGGDGEPGTGRIWVHAVSLGETRAAEPLLKALRRLRPDLKLLLTHGTATGREAGRALLADGDAQAWLPYDTPGAVRRFLARHRPAVGVLMETEVWPNLLHAARAAGVPVVLANARLSERSFGKGERLAPLMRPAAASFVRVLAQTADDARRLRAAGAGDVRVAGNLKFDVTPDPAAVARGRAWRAALDRPIVLAASTREGEEEPLLAAWARLASAAPSGGAGPAAARPLLLLVPRHPQRFDAVAKAVAAAGFACRRRSGWGDAPPADAAAADVWLGDSIGEMPVYYAAADTALLGGSFAPLGGQNLIEAAACGCPLVMGPHTFNFAQAAELSLAAGAARRAADIADGVAQAAAWARDPARDDAVRRALGFAAEHRGAAERMAQAIVELLPPAAGT